VVATTVEPDWVLGVAVGDADGDGGDEIALVTHDRQLKLFRLPDA
jgi:hypothetical protein